MSPTPAAHPHTVPQESAARIARRTWGRLLAALASCAVIVFFAAGTADFWEAKAWLFSLFVPAIGAILRFLMRDPSVLAHDFELPHLRTTRRSVVRWLVPLLLLALLVPGLDLRFGWSDADVETVPRWLALLADAVVAAGVIFAAYTMEVTAAAERAAAFKSRALLVATGPYHIVRHPLYAGTFLIWLATPIALGSWVSLPVFLLLAAPVYVVGIRNREKLLLREVPGYAAYCKRTPFRLIPLVW